MSLRTPLSTLNLLRSNAEFHLHPHPLALLVLLGILIQQSLGKDSDIRNYKKDVNNNRIDVKENKERTILENVKNKIEVSDHLESILNTIDTLNTKYNSINKLDINEIRRKIENINDKIDRKLFEKTGEDKKIRFENKNLSKQESLGEEYKKRNKGKSRQKRILWLTEDGRLALPPGTTMVITPSLSMPFVRYPPEGFFSNITISLPFTIDFNKLGLTDNENPYGVLPPVLARSMGRAAGGILADYIGSVFEHRRGRRSPESRPIAPSHLKTGHFHGGERALLYVALEEMLENFGMDGKACLLRAICEVHAHPMQGFGLVGEIMKLFLSASKSPYSELMKDYVEAETAGRGGPEGHGECWPYMKDCPKSLFMTRHNKYSEEEFEENEIPDEDLQYRKKSENQQKVTYNLNQQNM